MKKEIINLNQSNNKKRKKQTAKVYMFFNIQSTDGMYVWLCDNNF